MEGRLSWSGNVLPGQLQERNQRKRPPANARIFAGLLFESNLTKTAEPKRRKNKFGRRYGVHGRTVTGLFQAAVRANSCAIR
jgi:hypothetical protein